MLNRLYKTDRNHAFGPGNPLPAMVAAWARDGAALNQPQRVDSTFEIQELCMGWWLTTG